MNAGIAQGFVRFGTLAHRILVIAYEQRWTSNRAVHDELKSQGIVFDHSNAAIAANLARLRDHGFLYIVGRDRGPTGRSFALYAITPRTGNQIYVKPMTPAERTRKYRARKAVRVPSVFNFRGKIKVTEERV
jgi:hypothetical protein